MNVPLKHLIAMAAWAVLWAAPTGGLAEQGAILSGRVVEEKTGDPVRGVEVGAIRLGSLGDKPPSARVKPEKTVATDQDGRFQLAIPPETAGIDEVTVFTCSRDRVNAVYPNVTFGTPVPRVSDLRRKGAKRLDLTGGAVDVILQLPPAPRIKRDVMVPMRDGIRLATDIYLPADETAPLPALLYRTPYGKSGQGIPSDHLDKGFAVVWQDFRGRFASEGATDLPFLPDGWGEVQDGYDAVEWVAAQPWCNGKVGTMGSSAGGITQVLTAGAAPPHLRCQTINVACGSMYHHAAFVGGAFRKADVGGWIKGNKFSPECLRTFIEHPRYDEFWRSMDASTRSAQINAPGLFSGGWYDVFCQGTIDAFMWRQYNGGPGAKGRQKLVMGPWVHGRSTKIGEFTLPDQSMKPPLDDLQDAWLDHWLKGAANGCEDAPAVTYYVMGAFDEPGAPGHEWRQSDVWPVPAEATAYYLHADGSLSTALPGAEGGRRTFEYDPDNPVLTLGGCNLTMANGPFDQRPMENRPDVLLYTSQALTRPLEVTGQIKAILFASSSCRDTDFTAKLTDVYPDGKSVLIQDGLIRARFRNSFEREELLEPGKVYRLEIDLWSTSVIFNKGHRIRLAVSSSNSPRFEPNPNTGEPAAAKGPRIVARNTVYQDEDHASHILLPVVGVRERGS